MKKGIIFLSMLFFLFGISKKSNAIPLITTSASGYLVFEALEGHGATSLQEFGIGTPETSSYIFTMHLVSEHIDFVELHRGEISTRVKQLRQSVLEADLFLGGGRLFPELIFSALIRVV